MKVVHSISWLERIPMGWRILIAIAVCIAIMFAHSAIFYVALGIDNKSSWHLPSIALVCAVMAAVFKTIVSAQIVIDKKEHGRDHIANQPSEKERGEGD